MTAADLPEQLLAWLGPNRQQLGRLWLESIRADQSLSEPARPAEYRLYQALDGVCDRLLEYLSGAETDYTTWAAQYRQARCQSSSCRSDTLFAELCHLKRLLQTCQPSLSAAISREIDMFFDGIIRYVLPAADPAPDRSPMLLRSVTHELRNDLNNINMASRLLLQIDDPSSRDSVAKILDRGLNNMERVLDRLSAYTALVDGRDPVLPVEVQLDTLCHQLRTTTADWQTRPRIECDQSLTSIVSDPAKVTLLATMLLEYTTACGDGPLSCRLTGCDDRSWSITVCNSDQNADPQHPVVAHTSEMPESDSVELLICSTLAVLLKGRLTMQAVAENRHCFEVVLPIVFAAEQS